MTERVHTALADGLEVSAHRLEDEAERHKTRARELEDEARWRRQLSAVLGDVVHVSDSVFGTEDDDDCAPDDGLDYDESEDDDDAMADPPAEIGEMGSVVSLSDTTAPGRDRTVREQVLALLAQSGQRLWGPAEVAYALDAAADDYVRAVMRKMAHRGQLIRSRRGRYRLPRGDEADQGAVPMR